MLAHRTTVSWIGVLVAVIHLTVAEIPLKASQIDSERHSETTSSSQQHTIDQSPQRDNVLVKRAGTASICGYVTSDIHWPWACNHGQICDTSGQYLKCCNSVTSSASTSLSTTEAVYTYRNTLTVTSTLTYTDVNDFPVYNDCAAQSQCFNSVDADQCTGGCNKTALVCTDPWYPYCASVYYALGNTTSGIGFMCDTTSWGMTLAYYGYWPTSTITSTTYINSTITSSPTFTPDIVPFSRTQSWRAQQAIITAPTSSTSEAAFTSAPSIIFVCVIALLTLISQVTK